MYLGADTIGTWGVPARKEILAGAAPYIDGLFMAWFVGQPDITTSDAIHQYVTRYLGDKPLMNFLTYQSNPDSSLYKYSAEYVFGNRTQQDRGKTYVDTVSAMLSKPGYNGTYQWVGVNWWGLTDYWNEKFNWGLVSLNDNPYDGKSATSTARTDMWGFKTGGEERSYGNITDYIKQGNSLWWSGLLSDTIPK